jgi:hypothetical protein
VPPRVDGSDGCATECWSRSVAHVSRSAVPTVFTQTALASRGQRLGEFDSARSESACYGQTYSRAVRSERSGSGATFPETNDFALPASPAGETRRLPSKMVLERRSGSDAAVDARGFPALARRAGN